MLIIDQFEEIIAAHPDRWDQREVFFRQLDLAMRNDPNLWVVMALREDFVAALDPYAHLMSDRLARVFTWSAWGWRRRLKRCANRQRWADVRLPPAWPKSW